MRIQTNTSAQLIARHYAAYDKAWAVSAERMASGLRVNRPSDDPTAFSTASRMETQIRAMGVAERNIADAQAVVATAQDGASSVRELLLQLRDAVLTGSSAALEVESLVAAIDVAATDTIYNGSSLLTGKFGVMPATVVFDVAQITGTANDDLIIDIAGVGSVTVALGDGVTYTSAALTATIRSAFAASANPDIVELAESVTVASSGYPTTQRFAFRLESEPGTSMTVARPAAAPETWAEASNIASTGATARFQTGPNTGDRLEVTLADMTASGLSLDALDMSDPTGVAAALVSVDAALATTTDAQMNLGLAVDKLSRQMNSMEDQTTILTDAYIRLVAVDPAAETESMSRNDTMMSITAGLLAHAQQRPATILRLFDALL